MRQTQNLYITVSRRSKLGPGRIFTDSNFISIFGIALFRAAFCRIHASVCGRNFASV